MKKNVPLQMLTYEMLLETSKKSRKKPEDYLDNLIKKTTTIRTRDELQRVLRTTQKQETGLTR